MCRFLAYLGPPVGLEDLLWGPPHSLVHQSWAPRHQRQGAINADGFGVGWYDHALRPEPARWRSARPAWSERSFRSVAGLIRTGALLAAVRDATPPSPVEETNTPPFTAGRWLFAHNGAVDDFTGPAGVGVRRLLTDDRAGAVEGTSDSEILFALALDRLDGGAGPAEALAAVVAEVRKAASARLNLVLTDGRSLAATASGDSLFVLEANEAVVVASEPYDDDPRWHCVPDHSLVATSSAGITVTPLTPAGSSPP